MSLIKSRCCLLTALIVSLLMIPAARAVEPSAESTYAPIVNRIIDGTLKSNDAWNKMEQLCDGIGHRLSGSESLDRAVRWAADAMKADGQENVRLEPVSVPHWVRGAESLRLIAPREADLSLRSLGGSIGTDESGLTAEVLVVADERELESLSAHAKGKIILFNNPMPAYDPMHGSGYGTAVRFRTRGASLAAKHGALACLVRSVTARSLRSPHTGAMRYEDGVAKIPAAAISTEDAEMLSRLSARGETVRVNLKMQARDKGLAPSANVIGELRGREKPDEIVVIGGHIDSWDVGQGAHDDAGGCVISMEAINVLRRLKLIPRRTIRVVLWTNEENGLAGGKQYAIDHAKELPNHVAAIESDSGIFQPTGFSVECSDEPRQKAAAARLRELAALLSPIGEMKISEGHSGADVSPMSDAGVVLMGFNVEGSRYFDYHHSEADTLDKIDPRDLSKCVAAMAAMSYLLADMPEPIAPRQ